MNRVRRVRGPQVPKDSTIDFSDRLPLKPNHRFIIFHRPRRWQWNPTVPGENSWVPDVDQVPIVEGTGSVKEPPKGQQPNPAPLIASMTQDGATYIDPKDSRLGSFQNYAQYYDTQATTKTGQPGKYWVFISQEAEVIPPGKSPNDVEWNEDEAQTEWLEFLVLLRDEGLVAKPANTVIRRIIKDHRQRLDNLISRSADNPQYKAKIEALEKKISGMQADWDAWAGEVEEAHSAPVALKKNTSRKAKRRTPKDEVTA